jgi:phosphopentomutase
MRAICIVVDSAGIAPMPDQAEYGDVGASTIPNIAKAANGLICRTCKKWVSVIWPKS